MEKLIITVKSHHFKGNSYQHDFESSGRLCPLSEAIKEQLGKVHLVGSTRVFKSINDKTAPVYQIPFSNWQPSIVEGYISRANNDEEFTVNVELTKI